MNIEDRFASVGVEAFRFLCRSVGTQGEAAQIMEVGVGTVSRWSDEAPRDPFGRRPPKSWRPAWFGYPSPLPAYDRICERTVGRPYLEHLSLEVSVGQVLSRLRQEGLSLLQVLDREQIVSACRSLDIPDSSRLRWTVIGWPFQWEALDRLSRAAGHLGWPEFVLSYEGERRTVALQIPALQALLRPLVRRLHVRPGPSEGED